MFVFPKKKIQYAKPIKFEISLKSYGKPKDSYKYNIFTYTKQILKLY